VESSDEARYRDRVTLPLTRAAAILLRPWLQEVPSTAVPVTDPSERQALADLLFQLESTIDEPDSTSLAAARRLLLQDAGEWVQDGPIYEAASADPKAR
jgi:hypothetical protein